MITGELTCGRAALLLGLSPSAVRRWTEIGALEFTQKGARAWRRIPTGSLIEFLESTGRDVPRALRAWQYATDPQAPATADVAGDPASRDLEADHAWRSLIRDLRRASFDRPLGARESRAILELDATLQVMTLLTPPQRVGFMQAVCDVVQDLARIERSRGIAS